MTKIYQLTNSYRDANDKYANNDIYYIANDNNKNLIRLGSYDICNDFFEKLVLHIPLTVFCSIAAAESLFLTIMKMEGYSIE